MNEYHVNSKIMVTVKEIMDWVVVVDLGDGNLGRIPASEVSWSKRHKHPSEILNVGQQIEVIITGINEEKKLISLSLKQAKGNPWLSVPKNYPVDSVCSGIVMVLKDYGVFVELEDGLEGLVPIDELSPHYVDKPEEALSVGDKVRVVITKVEPNKELNEDKMYLIYLSIKKYLYKVEDEGGKLYLQIEDEKVTSVSQKFSDILKGLEVSWSREQKNSTQEANLLTPTDFGEILLVYDEVNSAQLLENMIRTVGYSIDIVNSGDRAIESVLNKNYDAIIMRITMQGMDGITAMNQILSQRQDVCIILADSDNVLNSLSSDDKMTASGILQLPAKSGTIDRTIRDAINGYKPGVSLVSPEVKQEISFIKTLSQAQDINELLEKRLNYLELRTLANACAIFEMNAITKEVELTAHIGISEDKFEEVKYDLRYSPISDVVIDNEYLLFGNIHEKAFNKFKHLLPITNFDSCIGVPITVFGRRRYGLFLFHTSPVYFTNSDLLFVEITAESLSSIFESNQVMGAIEKVQGLVFVGQILSGLSHDLGNRLRTLSRYTNMLIDDISRIKRKPLTSDKEDIETLDRHVSEIIRIVGSSIDIMDLFIKTTKSDRYELVEIRKCIQTIEGILEGQATQSRAKIIVNIDENAGKIKLEGRSFEQILLNLVLNALQQIEIERITNARVEVKISLDWGSKLPLKVRVSDNGPGIHRKLLDKLFDFGFTTKPGGAGIGLFLCKLLIEKLRGKISVEDSVIFLGTTFLLEFPANLSGR